MKKIFLVLALAFGLAAAEAATLPAGVAGTFYPADRDELAFQINKFLDQVPARPEDGEPIALIVPHAGYQYSGQIAANAYKLAAGGGYDRVILIGQSHKLGFDEIAVPDYDQFATPLGLSAVDRVFIGQMLKLSGRIKVNNAPFAAADNSLETQLPFIQTVLPSAEIVPLYFGSLSLANCQALAYVLSYLVDDRTLIVASSDWSHYYPDYLARKMDRQGIKTVTEGSLEAFIGALARGETEACGAPGIITELLLAPALGVNRIELVKYGNSSDSTGDKEKVVGYAAVGFFRTETKLSAIEQQKLLRIARRSIAAKLAGKKIPLFAPPEEGLNEKRGAFVTLKDEEKLRGCVGYIRPVEPLYAAVQAMAIAAATADERFTPVGEEEFKGLTIELSVLSRLRRIKTAAEIEIGRDGLYIIKGESSGVLLPQIAVEQKWDVDEFLKQLCLKAGLPEDAWQDKEAQLFRFSAQIIQE
jgi:MEMO1 family protein